MTYVYIIESVRDPKQHYTGITRDLKQRLLHHDEGKSPHTRKHRPWNLVAYIGFADEPTAVAFEHYLKTGSGRAFLQRHIMHRPDYDKPRR
jgi:putative endonuclease